MVTVERKSAGCKEGGCLSSVSLSLSYDVFSRYTFAL